MELVEGGSVINWAPSLVSNAQHLCSALTFWKTWLYEADSKRVPEIVLVEDKTHDTGLLLSEQYTLVSDKF